ncbi:MAG TPA: UDP-N-acetylmuramoyl-L-alanyl-D-glutamate--2,6-diaminopimelate ligase [Candidatus Polarisedimenticolia bacterium]|nr:UDP-N-acetylmuramoyl-L-alanyl-D-glutamate--2,6-diaminopimelate ligase [Candidatus Polarisedimenticolia bacterium]
MNLTRVFDGVEVLEILGPSEPSILGIACDSRQAEPGYLFAALRGEKLDGNDYVDDALSRGACAVLSAAPAPPSFPATWIRVADDRKALALTARNYYSHPDLRLGVTGVTGTNGKTTVVHLLESIFRSEGGPVCALGTLGYRIGREEFRAERTTPESVDLYRLLDRAASEGCRRAVMEVSSHSLVLHRVEGLQFAAAVFTNLTQDHLDFHHDMASYLEAKSILFRDLPAGRPAVINRDDPACDHLLAAGPGLGVTYGFADASDVRITRFEPQSDGIRLTLTAWGRPLELKTRLIGRINASNAAAAAAAALAVGCPVSAVEAGIAALPGVPGRLESVAAGQPFAVFVDYAHTDDALANTLRTVRELNPARLLVVFGCGGDRDRSKRPLMGAAAARLADLAILTSDNPRTENPLSILSEVEKGIRQITTDEGRYRVEPDRREAIRLALAEAEAGDAVVIAGKGHETYQILRERTLPFDDREVVREILRGRPIADSAHGTT